MLITRLHKFLTAPNANKSSPRMIFWFSLSLTLAAIYSILALQKAFSSEYVVQDDARQHVFWMRRFLDAGLFPNDLIADYFQSVAPLGYTALYQSAAAVGIDPLLLNKLLPLVLGLIATGYCFGVCVQLLPVPMAGFIATLLLNQNLWIKDDLASATPRAFLYPLLLAFLYYLLRRSLIPCGSAIALLGLCYPQGVFICAGILPLQLLQVGSWRPRFSQNRRDYWFCAVALGIALLVMLPYALKPSTFGSVVTGVQAQSMLEFSPYGRTYFFFKDPWRFWLYGQRSGLLPSEWLKFPYSYFLLMMGVGLSLPILLRFPSRFPKAKQVTSSVVLLPQVALASLGMFVAAHALLFKLHLPSRYMQHSLRILMALSAGIALTLILDAVFCACCQPAKPNQRARKFRSLPFQSIQGFRLGQFLALGLTVLLGAAIVLYPSFLKKFPNPNYQVGEMSSLYEFFQSQPKDILIASLVEEGNNLPTFTKRSILTAEEYAIPYHTGYYAQIRQRTIDLIDAQYSPELKQVQSFIEKYGIDFWLLDTRALTPEYLASLGSNLWIIQHQPTFSEALARLQQDVVPALAGVMERCSVFQTEGLVVLQAECIETAKN